MKMTGRGYLILTKKLLLRTAYITGVVVFIFLATELFLRKAFGLGKPVLYYSYPLYGYRPKPDQDVTRFHGARIQINNLGLRANQDWDSRTDDKILFLGNSVTYGGSMIDNNDLFSHLALNGLKDYKSGNGGVNGWGVENIHGLLVRAQFLPAQIYVSVIYEGDFYRGVSRIGSMPFWCKTPKLAMTELLYIFLYKLSSYRYIPWQNIASEKETAAVVNRAVDRLEEIDTFLEKENRRHLIYIHPRKDQALGKESRDTLISGAIANSGLDVCYMVDRLNKLNLTADEIDDLFYDHTHLTKAGHSKWGEIINADLKVLIARLDDSTTISQEQ